MMLWFLHFGESGQDTASSCALATNHSFLLLSSSLSHSFFLLLLPSFPPFFLPFWKIGQDIASSSELPTSPLTLHPLSFSETANYFAFSTKN